MSIVAITVLFMPRRLLRITGTVQGVGFRPHAVRLARELSLTGLVGNDASGVWCEIQGEEAAVDAFTRRIVSDAPPLASVNELGSSDLPIVAGEHGFTVATSASGSSPATAVVPPDVAPCDDCLAELRDPGDRRHGYAFTCCTDCGPRYTVIRALPYDRGRTSMAPFPLCRRCAAEYRDPGHRRYHAEATCCPDCGPSLALRTTGAAVPDGDPIDVTVDLVRAGAIVAVKGVGGYQLVCRASDDDAVTRLRERKHREEKPFALLVSSVDAARALVDLDGTAVRALTGAEAPIVLAPRRVGAGVADAVAPHSRLLGLMLPATPLHVLLAERVDEPLVCTSGNRSEEPIVIDDAEVETTLGPIADAVLTHDRGIERRADDSVGQVVDGRFQLLRRARGYAPRPVGLPESGPPVLGVGAELKSTICFALDRDAHLSAHLGDLEHPAALAAFEAAVADLLALTRAEPDLLVHDLHPEYLSTKFAATVGLAPTLAVQHHHAHLAACLADNGHRGPVIGLTLDGLGWGADDTAWGGEVLVGDATGYDRAAHLRAVPMPGGSAAIREPWRMAVAHLIESFGAELSPSLLSSHPEAEVQAVVDQCRPGRSIMTSSVGRLFDAVAALCGVGDRVSYEGQAAVRLEQMAGPPARSRYPVELSDGHPAVIEPGPLVRALVADLERGADRRDVAGGFHRWLADAIGAVCHRAREETGLVTVALTGGVVQNRLLVELVSPGLRQAGFDVLTHRQVPPNDGGIALGQVLIGRAHLGRAE